MNQPILYYNSEIMVTESKRGRPVLIYKNHSFRNERRTDAGREYWRCLKEGCKGRLVLLDGEIKKFNYHTLD